MSAYGKVIFGGAKMSKGLSKGINGKLAAFEAGHSHAKKIATAVSNAFKVTHLSDQTTNNVNGGKFQKVKPQKNV